MAACNMCSKYDSHFGKNDSIYCSGWGEKYSAGGNFQRYDKMGMRATDECPKASVARDYR